MPHQVVRGVGPTRPPEGVAASAAAPFLQLPRTLEAPAQARAAVSSRLHGRVADSTLADLLLIVSELVTNAVTHGQGEVRLAADLADGQVRGRVVDEGAGFVHALRDPGGESVGGRGLLVVDQLCENWGMSNGSTDVWFVIDLPRRELSAGNVSARDLSAREGEAVHARRTQERPTMAHVDVAGPTDVDNRGGHAARIAVVSRL